MSADVRVQGGQIDVSVISNTSTPIMVEVSREMVAMHAMQAILGWPEEERRVLLATHLLSGVTIDSMEDAVVEKAFAFAKAFENRRWKG